MNSQPPTRVVGMLGASSVGVGAIVGGGIFVLAGVAFETTGPSSLVAFAINGLIAVLTALSFAEMSTSFPESGGAYTFAKKVLSLEAAFAVGWILWFAYIVAAVLYALGFAEYAAQLTRTVIKEATGSVPGWLGTRLLVVLLGLSALGAYTLATLRHVAGGGRWATFGKVVVLVVLVLAGLWAVSKLPGAVVASRLSPFFPDGASGLLRATGFTFITLQGFDLIATIAGDIKSPQRTIPRAMLFSLGLALLIYLPLLFVVPVAGVAPGQTIQQMSRDEPGTVMAVAAGRYMGPSGYWLVAIAAILSTLSALAANILAASRVAFSMARDRTLPRRLSTVDIRRGIPRNAVLTTSLAGALLLVALPNLAAAGAAASLIFLIAFALAHCTAFLVRYRASTVSNRAFQAPWFPFVPIAGGFACAGMAVFQGLAVPSAGAIVAAWLGLGAVLYMRLFATRARAIDARVEAQSPELARLRGRSPLVLVPIANPRNAGALVEVAHALAPPAIGRVLLLAVMRKPAGASAVELKRSLETTQSVLTQALTTALASGLAPESLLTVAEEPWPEIRRVARVRRCESILLGLSSIEQTNTRLEALMGELDCDFVVLRSPQGWTLANVRRIVVPVGGLGRNNELRARMLGSLCRTSERDVRYIRVVPPRITTARRAVLQKRLSQMAMEEAPGEPEAEVITAEDPLGAIARSVRKNDLVVLGLKPTARLSDMPLRLAASIPCATILIRRGG